MIPEIIHPSIFIEQPSTKKSIPFRRYLVKEEKLLLFAKESKDINEIFKAIKDVLKICCLEPSIDIDKIPMFDLEYFFLMLRSHSVNNVENFQVTDREDEKDYTLFVEFDKIIVYFDENAPSKNIKINDQITIVMNYPKASIYDDKEIKDKLKSEGLFPLVIDCIENIFNNDEAVDISKKELETFVDNLDIKTFDKMKKFLLSTPSVRYSVEYTNSLGNTKQIVFNSLMDFFLYL